MPVLTLHESLMFTSSSTMSPELPPPPSPPIEHVMDLIGRRVPQRQIPPTMSAELGHMGRLDSLMVYAPRLTRGRFGFFKVKCYRRRYNR